MQVRIYSLIGPHIVYSVKMEEDSGSSASGSHIYRVGKSVYYDENAHILGLDYYDPDSQGKDDFTRKTVWFYVYGDKDIEDEFTERIKQLFRARFVDDEINWDLVTLYPTHSKGEVNVHLQRMMENVCEETGIEYEQVIRRNQTIEESHELETPKQKVVNLEGSVDITGDVEGKNIVVADNISLSGTSLIHATKELREQGAERVMCVVIGLSDTMKENDWKQLDQDMKASEIIRETSEPSSRGD